MNGSDAFGAVLMIAAATILGLVLWGATGALLGFLISGFVAGLYVLRKNQKQV